MEFPQVQTSCIILLDSDRRPYIAMTPWVTLHSTPWTSDYISVTSFMLIKVFSVLKDEHTSSTGVGGGGGEKQASWFSN